jgi:hypothetical protein
MQGRSPWPLAIALGLAAGLACGWMLGSERAREAAQADAPETPVPAAMALRPQLLQQGQILEEIARRLDAIEGRLDELARAIAGVEQRREPALPPPAAADVGHGVADTAPPEDPLGGRGERRLRALQAIALDETRSNRERVVALGELWRIDLDNGTKGARTPEMVDSLLVRLELEPDPELRRLMCFNVLDALRPWHKRPLIRALELDPEASVRAQAADSLQDLQDQPDVRAALERASTGDPDEKVRAVAAEMLSRWPPAR